ncbi:MAG: hypothetical protein PGMFKBFP_02237 [Anaerolineales bacterium]|nr:hypothetical protein [Anaerolineales bacterium]
MTENFGENRIHFLGRGRRPRVEEGEPARDVVGMGVEVLRGMGQPPEGLPCRRRVAARQRGAGEGALFLDVRVGSFEAVVVEVEVVVTELVAQAVLPDVCAEDGFEGARACFRAEGQTGDLDVMADEHDYFSPMKR